MPQLLVPLTADLALPDPQGHVEGTVMSGLLVGIRLSRTLASFVDEAAAWKAAGWTGVCVTGAALSAVALLLLGVRRPADRPAAVRHTPVT